MTTADIMFAQPGNRTIDHEYNARAVLWALLAAIFIHLVIAFLLAVFGGVFSPALPMEDKPVQLTFVDLARPNATAAPEPPEIFMDESKQSVESPIEKTYKSNVNTVAASELPATGEAPLPSQNGKERKWMDLETQSYTPQTKGVQPQPSAAPEENPKPRSQSASLTPAEQFALLASTVTPTKQASTTPRPASAFRAPKEQTRLSGSITNRGPSSVNSVGTPLLRYRKAVVDAIGSHWHAYVDGQLDLLNIGTLKVHFYIGRNGELKNLQIVQNTSNEAFANVCLRSVQDSRFPPIPDDIASSLPPDGLEVDDFSFTIYPN